MLNDKRILIIDDSDTIRTYLQNVLAQKGATEVDGATTGQEGLAKCVQHPYDLILLDLFLPDTDGIDVLKNIRITNDTSTIVMITGYGGIKSAIAAVQMGADGYIEKQEITSTLRDHIDFLFALEHAMEHRAGLIAQKQLDQIRSDFYAMVTHDLRNPTCLILLAADMLANNSTDIPQQQLVQMIDDAAHTLIRLINDYLDFAKIDAGYLRLDLAQVDLIPIVESSTRFAHLQAQAKQQSLVIDMPSDPIHAWIDAERFKQVLDNLLSNAIKYTPVGGEIRLHLSVEQGRTLLRVSDTGRGIPPDQMEQLFTKYHRVRGDTTRGILGTGLGLLIVKEIVEAHQGTVQVHSDGVVGKGTTFTINIPLQQNETTDKVARLEVPPQPAIEEEIVIKELIQDSEFRKLFWAETEKHLSVLQEALRGTRLISGDVEALTKARQASHALKGNVGAMQMTTLYELVAQLDGVLHQAGKGALTLTQSHLETLNQLLDRIITAALSEQPM